MGIMRPKNCKALTPSPAMQSTTPYHYVLLYRTRLVVVNRIDEAVVQDVPLPVQGGGQAAGLALDETSPSLYLYTSAALP